MMRTRLYRNGVLVAEDFPVGDISAHLNEPGATVWLDLCRPDADALARVGDELELHHLAVEAATHEHQRPKLDRYDNHLALTSYAVRFDPATGDLGIREVAVFVTRNALVTVHKSECFDVDGITARWDSSPDLAGHGVAFLLYGLLDYVVDSHFDAVQDLDDELEALEDQLFAEKRSNSSVQRRSFELRKSLVRLRRVVLPMREVVNSLMRRDLHLFDDAMLPYYQDVYDHVLRATEWTESLRDMVSAILETNLAIQGNHLNVITKQVTSWAAIIAVPTAITGFYGQNVPYPGFATDTGFYTSSGVIVVLSAGLYLLFSRRGWI